MNFLLKTVVFFLFFIIPFQGIGKKNVDSLQLLLSKTTIDASKIDILLDLSWIQRRTNPLHSIDNAFLALELSEKCTCIKNKLKSISFIGVALRSAGYYDEALIYFEKTLTLSNKQGIREELAYAYINIGYTYLLKKEYKLAEKFLFKSSELANELNSIQLKDYSYSYIITLYFETKKYKKALAWSNKIKDVRFERGINSRIGTYYQEYGEINVKLKQYNKALNSYKKAIEITKKDSLIIYTNYSKIAILYLKQNKFKQSLSYASKAFNTINSISSSGFREIDFTHLKIELCETLISIYKENKDYEKLIYYQNENLLQKEKIINDKTIQNIINADTHKRLNQKELENKELDRIIEQRILIELIALAVFLF